MVTQLQGPADADNYRIKVGRYGDRWYTDPLPECELAPASDWQGPSVSTTKPPFANKYVPMKTIADMPDAEWERLAKLTATDRYEAIKVADRKAGRTNMDRGSLVHSWAEDLVAGRPIMDQPIGIDAAVIEQARRFRPALEAFFDTHQPEPLAVEVVCLHRTLNGVGYGGTADIFARIDGDVWAIDWKSRNSDHAAYLEEAAQGGAYIGAEYMIIDDNGTARRTSMPDVAGVLIVSITDDGFRAFPIDRDGAITAYHEMHRWWHAQQQVRENKVIGRPWAPKATPVHTSMFLHDTPEPADRDHLRARIAELMADGHEAVVRQRWPQGVPPLSQDGHTGDQLAAILTAVRHAEADVGATFHPDDNVAPTEPAPRPTPPTVEPPDEGGMASEGDVAALERAFQALPADALAAIKAIAEEAKAAGRHISVALDPTVRRWSIARALVRWAASDPMLINWGGTIPRHDTELFVRAAHIATPAQTADADQSLGALLGSFTIEQANQLADAYSVDVTTADAA